MQEKSVRKIGLFVSLMLLIGSVVGIGIFFKNASVAKATGNNGLAWLLSWIIGGVISLGAALSFSEIGSFRKTKLTGLSSWAYKIYGVKAGYGVSFLYSLFYYGLLTSVLGIFGSEIFFFFLSGITSLEFGKIPFWVIVVVGLLFSVLFLALNHLSIRTSGIIQTVVTFTKFIPLIVAVIVGIAFFDTHNSEGGVNAFLDFEGKAPFGLKGMIVAIPAVLFSYDAFLVAGSVRNKMKNASKNLPFVILFGMTLIVILYTLIAVSSILHNSGIVWTVLADTLPKTVSKYIIPSVVFFILISTFGVINGITLAFISETYSAIDLNLFFGSYALKRKIGAKKTELIYNAIILTFWAILILVPSVVLKMDSWIDGATNYPTVFFFGIYGFVIGSYLIKRNKITETKKLNSYLFYTFSVISVAGIAFVEVVYLYTIFSDLFNPDFNSSWGLFRDNGKLIYKWVPVLVYFLFLGFCIGSLYLNIFLEKKVFKRNILEEMKLKLQEYEAEN
ncbi:APC family permease [Mycoplasma sp. 5370]